MFLTVKKGTSALLCLEAAEATLATVYASIKEEYKNLELELVFNKPEIKVFYNIVSFVRELDKVVGFDTQTDEEDSKIENVTLEIEDIPVEESVMETLEFSEPLIEKEDDGIELTIDTEELIISSDEIDEPIDFEEKEEIAISIEEPVIEESVSEELVIEEQVSEELVIEEPVVEVVQEPKVEVQETIVPKVPNTPGDRMMESLKEQQKNEGLLELEGDKVNTLAYREHLINYMKLGFACSLLKKKVKECNDTAEQSRLYNFCDNIEKRTDEYEMKFKDIGLTSGQVGTFRMEVLRDIRKYQDDTIRELCDYINKLYALSDNLMKNLK